MDIIIIKELISKFLGDRLTKILEKGTDRIADEISQLVNNKISEYLVAEYNCNYKTKNLLHNVEPVELEKFYLPLCLHRPANITSNIRHLDNNRIGTKHLKNLVGQDKNCIAIIGSAGSGKSTLVKYLFIDCIRDNYKIPIRIELFGMRIKYLTNLNFC